MTDDRIAWTVEEAARRLSVSKKTINRRIANGTLVSTKKLGRRLILAESALALFEAAQ